MHRGVRDVDYVIPSLLLKVFVDLRLSFCTSGSASFSMACPVANTAVELNPVLQPLNWLLGCWESDEPGEGTFPTIKPFRYTEKLQFSHVGQPVINYTFNAFHAETNKPMHRECGFIRIQPGTNKVAFINAQNTGLVDIEEGELTGQQLKLQTQSVARISFAKEPHVQQISRVFQLRPDGKLEQTVTMATDNQPPSQHLHITYRRSS
ncbi:THAP domain-containing protein 4 isoform X2 [Kryptolebias marmoratus]|uniref:THAP domain-containing protein 4 isoform X2 n=1 Tax=Kryptolebias marmoratus TaxID=37003 RepID=UPI0007F871A3|nr:THAP domain-containing protein 4 isoform X2 [Kryptolebias marmoratus]